LTEHPIVRFGREEIVGGEVLVPGKGPSETLYVLEGYLDSSDKATVAQKLRNLYTAQKLVWVEADFLPAGFAFCKITDFPKPYLGGETVIRYTLEFTEVPAWGRSIINSGEKAYLGDLDNVAWRKDIFSPLWGRYGWSWDRPSKRFTLEKYVINDLEENAPLVLNDCEATTSWSVLYAAGTVTKDEDFYIRGSASIRGTMTAVGPGELILDYQIGESTDLSGKDLLCLFVTVSDLRTDGYVQLTDYNGHIRRWYRTFPIGKFNPRFVIILNKYDYQSPEGFDLSIVGAIQIRMGSDCEKGDRFWVDRILADTAPLVKVETQVPDFLRSYLNQTDNPSGVNPLIFEDLFPVEPDPYFTEISGTWTVQQDGQAHNEGGSVYCQSDTNYGPFRSYITDSDWGKIVIKTKIKMWSVNANTAFGIKFLWDHATNTGYQVIFAPPYLGGKVTIQRYDNGVAYGGWGTSADYPFGSDEWHNVEIVVKVDKDGYHDFTIYASKASEAPLLRINYREFDATAPISWTSGEIELFTVQAHVHWDDLTIRGYKRCVYEDWEDYDVGYGVGPDSFWQNWHATVCGGGRGIELVDGNKELHASHAELTYIWHKFAAAKDLIGYHEWYGASDSNAPNGGIVWRAQTGVYGFCWYQFERFGWYNTKSALSYFDGDMYGNILAEKNETGVNEKWYATLVIHRGNHILCYGREAKKAGHDKPDVNGGWTDWELFFDVIDNTYLDEGFFGIYHSSGNGGAVHHTHTDIVYLFANASQLSFYDPTTEKYVDHAVGWTDGGSLPYVEDANVYLLNGQKMNGAYSSATVYGYPKGIRGQTKGSITYSRKYGLEHRLGWGIKLPLSTLSRDLTGDGAVNKARVKIEVLPEGEESTYIDGSG